MVNKAQWEYIESEYFLTTHPIQSAEYSVRGTHLLRQEQAEAFVEWYASHLKACVPEVACTFFYGLVRAVVYGSTIFAFSR
jgi:hypothetical protein